MLLLPARLRAFTRIRRPVPTSTEVWLWLAMVCWALFLWWPGGDFDWGHAYPTLARDGPRSIWGMLATFVAICPVLGYLLDRVSMRVTALVLEATWFGFLAAMIAISPIPGIGWAIYGIFLLMALWSAWLVTFRARLVALGGADGIR